MHAAKETLAKHIVKNKYLYLMLIPGLVYFGIFHYGPMYGILMAFKNFSVYQGIWGSPWVGWQHFETLLNNRDFHRIFRNSALLGVYKLIFTFPMPIILALLLNEIRLHWFRRSVQTVVYMPHFLSWVIVGVLVIEFLSPTRGILNEILHALFGTEPILFLSKKEYFRPILILSNIWKETGWGTIIYLAAIAGVDQHLYEAAKVDGANRFRCIWHVTLPCIMTTILIVFIIQIGYIIRNSFEQVFVLYNPLVYEVGDVFETYIYRVGLNDARFDYATAVGIFQSVIGLVLLVFANTLANRFGERGIY